jgi:hypothetical protein
VDVPSLAARTEQASPEDRRETISFKADPWASQTTDEEWDVVFHSELKTETWEVVEDPQ